MTVSYTAEVATVNGFGCFLKLLRRWHGSIYKLIWRDLLAFLALYYSLNMLYLFALSENDKHVFESVVHYCNRYSTLIPLSFVLGFYVTIVMHRWWDQYISIPWPDNIAVFVSAHLHGQDERGRVMRRTIMRYVCLCLTMVFTMIAPRVKKRFPTLEHLIDAGLLLENEKQVIDDLNNSFPKYPKHWIAIVWAASIVTRARKEGRIRDDFSVKTIIDALNAFRGNCGRLLYYDTISVPLVYTQVVTLAVYTYFLCNVMGHQWTEDNSENIIDLYFPIFTTLQFFFYMGWLKVAEALINPFGDDDDDFEVNWMIDRNLQVSYLIVDDMHHEHPELVKDQYWDEVFPNELPYQPDTKREKPPEPSTARLDLGRSNILVQSPSKLDTAKLSEGASRFNMAIQRLFSNETLDTESQPTVDPEKQQQPYSNGTATTGKYSDTVHFADERNTEESSEPRTLTEQQQQPQPAGGMNMWEIFKQDDAAMKQDSDISVQNGSVSSIVVPAGEEEATSDKGTGKDEFEQLKEERDRERLERQKQKIVRGIDAAANINLDAEVTAARFNTPSPSAPVSRRTSHESPESHQHQARQHTEADADADADSEKVKEDEEETNSQRKDPAA